MAFTRIGVGGVGRTLGSFGGGTPVIQNVTVGTWAQWVGKDITVSIDVTETVTAGTWQVWLGRAFTFTGQSVFINIARSLKHTFKRLMGFKLKHIDHDDPSEHDN